MVTSTFYLHVRSHAQDTAFAVIGPYQTLSDAVTAAKFAHLPFWTVEQTTIGAAQLF
jgi:hypothetical protein